MLNSPTKIYPENEQGGLLICGINWGGDPDESQEAEEKSFFSDSQVNAYRLRSRVVNWFRLFGHPLVEERGKEGPFERSIIQTNWLRGKSRNVKGKNLINDCSANAESLLCHLEKFHPRLILFLSNTLLMALNSPPCKSQVEEILGACQEPSYLQKDVVDNGNPLKRFTVGIQRFERCDVIALPHPTGRNRVSNAYIAAFREQIEPILSNYRQS